MNELIEKEFRLHAEQEYPRECCGLLAVVKGREKYFPCVNSAEGTEHFIISEDQYSYVDDLGEIIAVLHSHPDVAPTPSQADRVSCEATGLVWHIVGVEMVSGVPTSNSIVTIAPEGYKAPLIGREFYHGVLDCYTLIRDWYKEERSIELPDFIRRDEWWADGHSDLYTEGFPKAGFISMGQSAELQVGDVILMQVRSKNEVPNHAGIYIGNSQILHHMYGRLSSRDIYGGFWRELTRDILRYKGT